MDLIANIGGIVGLMFTPLVTRFFVQLGTGDPIRLVDLHLPSPFFLTPLFSRSTPAEKGVTFTDVDHPPARPRVRGSALYTRGPRVYKTPLCSRNVGVTSAVHDFGSKSGVQPQQNGPSITPLGRTAILSLFGCQALRVNGFG